MNTTRLLAITLIVAIIFPLVPPNIVLSASKYFKLITYSYTSSAGTHVVYPGSRQVELVVETRYTGSNYAEEVSACIELPKGFSVSRGSSACSPPYTPNGSIYAIVKPGDVVVFKYRIDISKDVTPGNYSIPINISFVTNSVQMFDNITVYINVSPYPSLTLKVVDWYWSPDAYPGSQGVSLNIVLENLGNSTIVDAHIILELPNVFDPHILRSTLTSLGKNERTTITLSNINVYPNATPNKPYTVIMKVNATARTDDGVEYNASTTLEFNVSVHEPPYVWLETIDYGITAPHSVKGLRYTHVYVTYQLKSFVTVRAITAVFRIVSGGKFVNGSKVGVTTVTGSYGYGDFITIESPLISFEENADRIVIDLNLTVFGSKNGAEFWSIQTYRYIIRIENPSIDLEIVDVYWSSQEVYPGTASAELRVVVQNLDSVDLTDAVATLVLPKGFSPSKVVVSQINIPHTSRATIRFSGITIDTSLKPGLYIAYLHIDGLAKKDSSCYRVHLVFSIGLYVSSYNKSIFTLLRAEWIGGRAYTTSISSSISVCLQVATPVTVKSLVVEVHLPPQLIFEDGSRTTNVTLEGPYTYGDQITFRIESIDSATTTPEHVGIVLLLHALIDKNGVEAWVNQSMVIVLQLSKPIANLSIIYSGWNGGKASSLSYGAEIFVQMLIEHIDPITTLIANLTLLKGASFEDGKRYALWTYTGRLEYGSIVTSRFDRVDVEASYVEAELEVLIIARLGSGYYKATYTTRINVSAIEKETVFMLTSVSSMYRGEYAPILPTAKGVVLHVVLTNIRSYSISSVKPIVILPTGFELRRIDGSCISGVGPGSSCYLDIELNVDTSPGIYIANLSLTIVERVESSNVIVNQSIAIPIAVADPRNYIPTLIVLNAYWGNTRPTTVFEHQRNVPLTITVMNIGRYSVNGVYVEVKLLNTTAKLILGRELCAQSLQPQSICRVTLYLDLANVSSGILFAEVAIHYTFTMFGTHIEWVKTQLITLRVERFSGGRGLKIVDYGWHQNLEVYPNTYNATFVITFANLWPYRIAGIEVELHLPKGFKSKNGDIATAYIAGPINSLQTFEASFLIDVYNVTPGAYPAKVVVRYIVLVGGAQILWTEEKSLDLIVKDVEKGIEIGHLPNLILVAWHWGIERPQTVYNYQKQVPLTVEVMNVGIPNARGVWVEIEPLNSSLHVVVNHSTCAPSLAQGATCRATFYLDIGSATGVALFKVTVHYIYQVYKTVYSIARTYTIALPIERFAGGIGLELVDSGWANNWPVYPNTENATYIVTLANRWPYTISGIDLWLILPPGFVHKGKNFAHTYIDEDVRSLKTFTADFVITVKNVSSGRYVGKLVAQYIVMVGGSQLRWVDTFNVTIDVQSLNNAITLLTPTWYGYSPQPHTYGTMLIVRIRNNYIPRMSGVILELYLPPGFTCSLNNKSYAIIPAETIQLQNIPYRGTQNIAGYLQSIMRATRSQTLPEYSYGSIITFYIPLNILVDEPGTYIAKAYLNFIDQWNNVRRIAITIPIHVLGASRIIVVSTDNTISFENGSAILRVCLENVGTSPIYNTYIVLVPHSPIALPTQNIKYVGTINPNKKSCTYFNLTYNPFNIVTAGGLTVQYHSLPMTITVIYRDALGYQHVFNVSAAVLIQPFVFIALSSNTYARIESGNLIISGTVINYGISTARSVWIEVVAASKRGRTFVGDIDPASQAAFRVEVHDVPTSLKSVKLIIKYLDEYGKQHYKVYYLTITKVLRQAITAITPSQQLTFLHLAVIAGVATFLAIAGITIALYLRKHGKALEQI